MFKNLEMNELVEVNGGDTMARLATVAVTYVASSAIEAAANNNPRVDYNSESATCNAYNNGYWGH